eukprot:10098374-Alexandrium_andersonii.AAC.1
MSASLVGSEMCIRDRPRNPLGIPSEPLRDPLGICAVPGSNASSDFQAVSYTHLTLPTICSV